MFALYFWKLWSIPIQCMLPFFKVLGKLLYYWCFAFCVSINNNNNNKEYIWTGKFFKKRISIYPGHERFSLLKRHPRLHILRNVCGWREKKKHKWALWFLSLFNSCTRSDRVSFIALKMKLFWPPVIFASIKALFGKQWRLLIILGRTEISISLNCPWNLNVKTTKLQ